MKREHRRAIGKLRAGDWQAAHVIVQALEDPLACRLHALCHRIEGDLGNARYWYRRARVPFPGDVAVADELEAIERDALSGGEQ
jgi:hypothetical protein